MDEQPPRRKTAAYWRARFEAEGLRMHPHDSVLVDMETVDAIRKKRKYTDEYISEKSKELHRADESPAGFDKSTLKRARREAYRIRFGSAYTIAMILDCDPLEVAILDPVNDHEDEDIGGDGADDTTDQPAGHYEGHSDDAMMQGRDADAATISAPPARRPARTRIYTVGSIVPEISLWLRLLTLDVVLVSAFYCLFLALGGYEWLRVAFPLVHGGGAFAIAYIARSRGRFPMPINLRILIGLVAGVLTGMVAFFAIAVLEPARLLEFEGNPTIQTSMILFIASGIVAFMAGHELASRRRTRPLAGPGRRMFHWSYPLAVASTSLVAAIGAANMTP